MLSRMKKELFLIFVFFIFISCFLVRASCEEYIIGPEDVLEIVVPEEKTLTNAYPVDKDGNINMTHLKEVKVSGLTANQVAKLISDRLKNEGYLVNPQVTVNIKEYHSQKIMVFGTVQKPGEYYLKGKTLVLDLLRQIGYAEQQGGKMVITRNKPSGKGETIPVDLNALILHGDMSQNIQILPQDSIIVYSGITKPVDTSGAQEYIIGPDDVLDVVVWKEDNLTKAYNVDKDGLITMPYLKEVKVSGLITEAAAGLIAERLKNEGYLVNPVVTVSIKEYRSRKIMVFGLVKTPGNYYLKKEKTMALDLLSLVGHTEQTGGKMTVLRKTSSGKEEMLDVDLHALILNGDLSQNIEILGGDKIIISRISTGQQIYVLGEVKSPGPYTIERDLSVLEVLRLAGGLTDFANKSKVKIIREVNGKKKNIFVNLNKIAKGQKEEDVALQAGDVLVALKSWF